MAEITGDALLSELGELLEGEGARAEIWRRVMDGGVPFTGVVVWGKVDAGGREQTFYVKVPISEGLVDNADNPKTARLLARMVADAYFEFKNNPGLIWEATQWTVV